MTKEERNHDIETMEGIEVLRKVAKLVSENNSLKRFLNVEYDVKNHIHGKCKLFAEEIFRSICLSAIQEINESPWFWELTREWGDFMVYVVYDYPEYFDEFDKVSIEYESFGDSPGYEEMVRRVRKLLMEHYQKRSEMEKFIISLYIDYDAFEYADDSEYEDLEEIENELHDVFSKMTAERYGTKKIQDYLMTQ